MKRTDPVDEAIKILSPLKNKVLTQDAIQIMATAVATAITKIQIETVKFCSQQSVQAIREAKHTIPVRLTQQQTVDLVKDDLAREVSSTMTRLVSVVSNPDGEKTHV